MQRLQESACARQPDHVHQGHEHGLPVFRILGFGSATCSPPGEKTVGQVRVVRRIWRQPTRLDYVLAGVPRLFQ